MRRNLTVGILGETKYAESRAPLTPDDVRWLVDKGVSVEVETRKTRVFSDEEYRTSGAAVVDKFRRASLLVGIKEVEPNRLLPRKAYLFFSHTVKGQAHNMPLLQTCVDNHITLIDYERIVDRAGNRLVYFGRFAGVCGMADSLHYYGKKLDRIGSKNPFAVVRPAHEYGSLASLKKAVARLGESVRRNGIDGKTAPLIVGVTGHGHVLEGVREILDLIDPVEIHPRDMPQFVRHEKTACRRIFKIIFLREEKIRKKNGKGFYFEEYLRRPGLFVSNLDRYLPYITMLINTSYWDNRYPRLVPRSMVRRLARRKPFRLQFIGDISCDIAGSVELTNRATTPDEPVYTYLPRTDTYEAGCGVDGITILARDNLPAELPADASVEFSRQIRDYVYQIAAHGVVEVTAHAALPAEIRGAVITEGGMLTPAYRRLAKFLKRA